MQRQYSVTYNPANMIASDWRGWDDIQSRQSRYEVYDGYYHNVAYLSIASYAESLKQIEKLYKHVRGVYNPVNRVVESYVSKLYGGKLNTQNATDGAIVLQDADERLVGAITRLWRNSRWQQKKSLYVRNGGRFGDSFIKVVDDIQRGMTYMEAVNPSMVKDWEVDPTGTLEYLHLEYYIPAPADVAMVSGTYEASYVLYGEVWTPDSVYTTIEGKRAAIHTNARGQQVDEWQNEYGFIPAVHVPHIDVGLKSGATPFYTQLHKINELNDLASNLNDAARNQANMPLVMKNAKLGSNNDFGSDNSTNQRNRADSPKRDSKRIIEISGADADLVGIPPTLSLSDGMMPINGLLQELERDMPELALHRLREGNNLTAPGVRSAYDDAIARYQEARGNYNEGLITAQKMGVAIAGMRNYAGFEGYQLQQYFDESLDHMIADKPVIGDSLSKGEKITFTLQAMQSNAPATIYKEIGWDDNAIQDIQAAQQQQTNMFMQVQSQGNSAPVDPDETPEDATAVVQERRVDEDSIIEAQQALALVS